MNALSLTNDERTIYSLSRWRERGGVRVDMPFRMGSPHLCRSRSPDGGPLARSAALRHPIHKNIRMGGGRSGNGDTFRIL